MINTEFFDEIKKLKAIAEIGLLYSESGYDKERYTELQNIAFRLLQKMSGYSIKDLRETFPLVKDYPTAKVDIRGLVLSGDKRKILLVKESIDGKWSLPGGWADVGYSPKETVIKEFKEETGLNIIPEKLIAVFDTKMHPHPSEPFYVYKMIFYCKTLSSQTDTGFDILDARYFDINNLPEFSENRILKSQVEFLYHKVISLNFETYFD
jgi:ADP-ribose pyrophosphatase YjhB (NUDIX family)